MPTPEEYLIPPGEEPDVGKTLAALRKSRGGYAEMIALFGGKEWLPSSIMTARRGRADAERDAEAADRCYADSLPEVNRKAVEDDTLPDSIKSMHRMNSGSLTGALSKFPQEIGRTVVLFYSNPGDLVVDPFAGHNSRMELVVRAGRDYEGCDLSEDFMKFNRRRADELRALFPKRSIQLHLTDSRRQPIPNAVGDFTLTSPPYWDVEWYGPEDEQLGKSETYSKFLDGMYRVVCENFRTLKPGSYSVWFINDFRRGRKMYFYHRDIIELGESSGFIGWDIIVVDLGRGLRDGFVNANYQLKMIPKRHEYAVVFRKPDGTENTTPDRSEYNGRGRRYGK